MFITKATLFIAAPLILVLAAAGQEPRFQLEEATIADVHRAIRDGQITCRGLVQAYLNRARAYNGVSDRLVTRDGAPIPPAPGTVRAGSPLKFPTGTVAISALLPHFDQYAGPPIEFGRMEATASDPDVQQQYGMTVGTPRSGQINALGTLNLRGERSVTCKGDRDKAPASGPLPAGSPAVCEELRKHPDALERAAALDAQYGTAPNLSLLPMYCIPFSFKDPFDTMDMRTTAGADARYDIDFPARDHTLVAELRKKGAIIYAKAVNTEYNGRAGDPGGRHQPTKELVSTLGYQRSSWAGNPSSAYDSTRAASLGSSSGSGASVSANLVMCSLGEPQGIDERLLLRELLRRVEMKVMQENRLDVVVRLHTPLPPGQIGLASPPGPRGDVRGEIRMGPFAGLTEVLIPAGYVRTVYDPTFVLSTDQKRYVATNNNTPTALPAPGLPFSLVFRAEPGAENRILKVASAYEAASKRRISPPAYPELRIRN